MLCTARAGNVIGGGDWAVNRLVPDLIRGAGSGGVAFIRNPESIRPWQHVLEPLCGYLLLASKLLAGEVRFADGWNFGPGEGGAVTVREVVARMQQAWDAVRAETRIDPHAPHEARLLTLDCSKARTCLGGGPVWDGLSTVEVTAAWYRRWYERGELASAGDITRYTADARRREPGIPWRSMLIEKATWHVYASGFWYGMLGRRVPYLPTPKDGSQEVPPRLLAPHWVVIALSLAAMAWVPLTYHRVETGTILMMFFAAVNAVMMVPIVALGIPRRLFARRVKVEFST